MIKKGKMKTRNKIEKSLSENTIVTDIKSYISGSWFPPVYTETAPKLGEIRKKSCQVQYFIDILKNIYIQSLNTL